MFNGCSSLISLPDLSKWNINKVTDMVFMFSGCSLLISLSDKLYLETKNRNEDDSEDLDDLEDELDFSKEIFDRFNE